ncbi:MAG TPA: nitrilase-related carbon-nitrogen hydrolase, partial [Chthoniobacterales bacterium]
MPAKPSKSAAANFGFFRVGVASPEHRVADCAFNAAEIVRVLGQARTDGCQLVVFPELAVTGYSCADLFYQPQLLAAARESVAAIAKACGAKRIGAVVGAPLEVEGRLFNAAIVIGADGWIAGVVPKTYLPTTGEFYEARWFTRGDAAAPGVIDWNGREAPFGVDLLFPAGEALVGVEICEDLWAIK